MLISPDFQLNDFLSDIQNIATNINSKFRHALCLWPRTKSIYKPVFHVLHTSRTRLGEVAVAAGPKRLILSHSTPVTEPHLKTVKQIVRSLGYYGKIQAAQDLAVSICEQNTTPTKQAKKAIESSLEALLSGTKKKPLDKMSWGFFTVSTRNAD